MMDMCGIIPLFINAGLAHRPTVPCLDAYGEPGSDPRYGDAVPRAGELFEAGRVIGAFLSRAYDSLVLGESVPAGRRLPSACSVRWVTPRGSVPVMPTTPWG